MSRSLVLGVFVFVSTILSGCASPTRIVRQDATSVVIAVPENTNVWPTFYRDEAKKVAALTIPDPILVGGTEVKIGETVTNSQNVDRRDLGGQNNKPRIGELTMATNSTTIQEKKEYHMEFQSKPNSGPPMSGGNGSLPPLPDGPPIKPVSGTQPPTKPNEVRQTVPPVSLPGNTPPSGFPTTGFGPK